MIRAVPSLMDLIASPERVSELPVRRFVSRAGIASGALPPRRLVHGRPLAHWLGIEQLARLMGAWKDRS